MINKLLVGETPDYDFGTSSSASLVVFFNCVDLIEVGFHSHYGGYDIPYELGTGWNKELLQVI